MASTEVEWRERLDVALGEVRRLAYELGRSAVERSRLRAEITQLVRERDALLVAREEE